MNDEHSGHRRRSSSLANSSRLLNSRTDSVAPNTPLRKQQIEEEGDELKPPSDDDSGSVSDDMELDDILSDEGFDDDEETGLTEHERKRRRRLKRRMAALDRRIAGDMVGTEAAQKLADIAVLKKSVINIILIASWYFFSLSISIYNKWMFSKDHLDFHFPLFTTCMHMLVQFALASFVLYFVPSLRPHHDPSEPAKPIMTRIFYITRIGPCGAATGLDIGLGNMSLKFITLTFYTMCKSSALGFVLLFAFLFRLEQPSIKLVLVIVTMTVGVVMMVAGETDFNVIGFVCIIAAAFFSGFRWALTQILLLRHPATSNPFSGIFFLAPVMFFALFVIALPIEGPGAVIAGVFTLASNKGWLLGSLILLFPGVLAFCMTSSEFALLQRTSVVTLSICGIFKEVVTIIAAEMTFHDKLTPINISGLFVTITSIAAYNYMKIKKMRQEARDRAHKITVDEIEAEYQPLNGEVEESLR